MEKIIKDSMNDKILNIAYELFDIGKDQTYYIGGFENIVYGFKKNGEDFILRFVHNSHRTYELVEAEIEFIDYLDSNNASVSTIVLSSNNKIVEKVNCDNSTYFSICVFTKAPGGTIKREQITKEFIHSFGKEVGKLHSLTKEYKPKFLRHQWYDENYLELGRRNLKKDDLVIVAKMEEIMKNIRKMK